MNSTLKRYSLAVLVMIFAFNAMAYVSVAPVSITGSDGSSVTGDGSGNLNVHVQAGSVSITGTPSVSVSNFPATQPVSGTVAVSNFPATQPVSAASLPLPTGASTAANQATTNSTLSTISGQLPAALGQTTMANSTPVVIASNQSAIPVSISGGTVATRSDTFTTAATGTTVDVHTNPVKYFSMQVNTTGTVTSWTVVLECSLDNVNFTTALTHTNLTPGSNAINFGGTTAFPCLYFRSHATALTLGSGTNVIATILGM